MNGYIEYVNFVQNSAYLIDCVTDNLLDLGRHYAFCRCFLSAPYTQSAMNCPEPGLRMR
jgi:hypothetical protein